MILLDSHTVLWAVLDNNKLGGRARGLIRSNPAYVSAVTHMELAIKAVRGGFRLPAGFVEGISAAGFLPLPLDQRHASGLNAFPRLDGHDPFDRILVAQAHVERFEFLTADRFLLGLGEPWIIDATE